MLRGIIIYSLLFLLLADLRNQLVREVFWEYLMALKIIIQQL